MVDRPDDTRSAADSGAGRRVGPAPEPHLFLAFHCDRPATPPLRLALGDLDEVIVGRGDRLALRRDGRSVRLQLDDAFMSTTHARLTRALDRWQLVDAGSKNGSLVDGARVDRRILADGDLIELGHTFFVHREALARLDGDPDAGPPALRTSLPDLARAFAEFAVVAPSSVSVVLHGEVGTGKELTARALHDLSRRPGAFVGVNCGALPAGLLESELFGHVKGAFSGAHADRDGLVRSADRGTLFLDEIGELPPPAQVALLRVLQEREVVPVGARRPIAVDLRVVAATHRDLAAMVAAGSFRADLLSRLSGFTLTLAPLRARREDLGLLVAALLARAAASPPALSPNAARCLLRHRWPGNVRELEKCLATAVLLARGGPVAREHLPPAVRDAPERPAPDVSEAVPDRDTLAAVLREHRGNVAAVARKFGRAPVQVRRWLKRHGLAADDFRDP